MGNVNAAAKIVNTPTLVHAMFQGDFHQLTEDARPKMGSESRRQPMRSCCLGTLLCLKGK
jgi:hypothetical protein